MLYENENEFVQAMKKWVENAPEFPHCYDSSFKRPLDVCIGDMLPIADWMIERSLGYFDAYCIILNYDVSKKYHLMKKMLFEFTEAINESIQWQVNRLSPLPESLFTDNEIVAVTRVRHRTGWTQKQLAERLGITDVAVSYYESGKRPEPQVIKNLCEMIEKYEL